MKAARQFIGTVPVDPVTSSQAIEEIARRIETGMGGFVFTPNVDHIALSNHHRELREAYQKTALSLADGQPLLWLSRLLGFRLPEKISGSDLIAPLMERAARSGWRVFIFGASAEVAEIAVARLSERYPGLQVVGRNHDPYWPGRPDSARESRILTDIANAQPQLIVVALGCPKQELWMSRYAAAYAPAVAIGLGASLDFVAGKVKRAPRWMSRAGLEWLFRLAQEPRRLAHRYLIRDLAILPIVLRQLGQTLFPPVTKTSQAPRSETKHHGSSQSGAAGHQSATRSAGTTVA